MFTHTTEQRVRYAETDKMGYLYYGHYAKYYEVGRVEMLRTLGISYRDMEDVEGILLPVMNMQMRFVRPAYYDDLLTVYTTVKKLPERHIVFHIEIKNAAGKLINGGTVKLCFLDRKTNKTVSAPDFLVKKLAEVL